MFMPLMKVTTATNGTRTLVSPWPNILTKGATIPVSVIKQVAGPAAQRRREEMRMIFTHKTLAPSGMNIDLKF